MIAKKSGWPRPRDLWVALVLVAEATVPSITLPMRSGECTIEDYHVSPVPPSTFKVFEIQRCGGFTCFRWYVLIEGVRRGDSRACGERDMLLPTMPPVQ
jgi:hypothetical protein